MDPGYYPEFGYTDNRRRPGQEDYRSAVLEVDAAPVLLPIAVAGRIGALTTADLFRSGIVGRGVRLRFFRRFGIAAGFLICVSHVEIMPDAGISITAKATTRYILNQIQAEKDPPYARIAVTGSDAVEFLQGQLTNDLELLGVHPTLLAALCSPKGRVIALFRVTRIDNGYGLLLPAELADDVVRRLTMFRFRAKVDFEILDLADDDPEFDGDLAAWRIRNLRAGIAEIGRAQTEVYTPHMLNLDLVDAISFDKGCYTGQEIVARTHYRGSSKRRLYGYDCEAEASAGDELLDGDRRAGTVVNAIGREMLAVVSSATMKSTLQINGAPANWRRLPYETVDGGFEDATEN